MKVFHDRTPVSRLADHAPMVLRALRSKGVGRTERKEHVHFCGMLTSPEFGTVVFVPLCAGSDIPSCRNTMKVLARYGNERPNRPFEDDVDGGNTGLLSLIGKLARDFRDHGVYAERTRVRGRDIGKPDWSTTVKKMRPLFSSDGEALYSGIATTRSIDSRETLLGRIHAQVMTEIMQEHGWWLDGLNGRQQELRTVGRPAHSRHLWAKLLSGFATQIFSTRGIRLAGLLIAYLEANRSDSAGPNVFGLEDFHSVWEHMLYKTVPDVIPDINARLPFASYLPSSQEEAISSVSRRMRADIVTRVDKGYGLLDAKYYAAQGPDSLPGWGDIAKQMVYEMALRKIVGPEASISNAFVFPTNANNESLYGAVKMMSDGLGLPIEGFPRIDLLHADISNVMRTYLEARYLNLPLQQIAETGDRHA